MILITGGAGAMGMRLVARLRARDVPVRVVGLPSDSDRHAVEALGAAYCGTNILDGEALKEHFSGVRGVVHLAALVLSPRDPELLYRINVDGTRNVAVAARQAGVERFVHVSSISVMYRNQNNYSRSKVAAESVVRESGLDWCILRPTLAWGDPKAAEYARFARAVERFPFLPLPGGGQALKSPVHVDDLAKAFDAALFTSSTLGIPLELPGPERISLSEMARRIRNSRKLRGRVVSVPSRPLSWMILAHAKLWIAFGATPMVDWQTWTGLVEDSCPDSTPAMKTLAWNPRPFDPSMDNLPRDTPR